MNIQRVREQLGSKFANVSDVSAGVLRCVRRSGNKDVAAYVFDLNGQLPETAAHLSSYLDDVMGRAYFDESAPPDLRWNHYLYFVVGTSTVGNASFDAAKRTVESDRSYARKFVINEDEIERVLNDIDSVAVADNDAVTSDVMQVWAEKLGAAGLHSVLETERAVADVVRIISSTTPKQSTRSQKTSGADASRILVSSNLASVDLSAYRQYPTRRQFDRLGRANLIVGANGVGKTSLIEGIEFLFCGANRRSDVTLPHKVSATLATGANVATTSAQALSDFKTRQRLWYGNNDTSRRNNLPNQFARFNFLNTDAAAELSLLGDSEKGGNGSNTDSLADLFSGHEATLLWRRIEAVYKAVLDEKRAKDSERFATTADKRAKEVELKLLEAAPKQSDAAFTILATDLERLGWRISFTDKNKISRQLADTLSALASRFGTVRQLDWLDGPVTVARLAEQGDTLSTTLGALRDLLKDLGTNERKRASLASQVKELDRRREALATISPEAAADLAIQVSNLRRVEEELSGSARAMAALPSDGLLDVEPEFQGFTVAKAMEIVSAKLGTVRAEISVLQRRLAEVTASQTRLQELLTQLRDLARKSIEHLHSDEACPVCSSRFEPGVLLSRMEDLSVGQSESEALELKRQLDGLLTVQMKLATSESRLEYLARFIGATQEDVAKISVAEATQFSSTFISRQSTLTAQQRTLRQTIENYQRTGLTISRLKDLCEPELIGGSIANESLGVQAALSRANERVRGLRQEVDKLNTAIESQLLKARHQLAQAGIDDNIALAAAVELIQERMSTLMLAQEACSVAMEFMVIAPFVDVRTLHVSLESAVLDVEKVLVEMENEASSGDRRKTLLAQLERHEAALTRLANTQERLSNALAVLRDIVENNSLEEATKAAVVATHRVADNIFSRIHAPTEYEVTADADAPLARRDNGKPVTLNHVSTGQRAAYALSIFLAMNAQVRTGPKVILLDDPISHIDDLNALSFLDYMRNLVLQSNRQIFFATADEKIAGLFSHKFGFLGDEFRTFELSRT